MQPSVSNHSPQADIAAAEAASERDQLYGQMLFSNRNYGWAHLLFEEYGAMDILGAADVGNNARVAARGIGHLGLRPIHYRITRRIASKSSKKPFHRASMPTTPSRNRFPPFGCSGSMLTFFKLTGVPRISKRNAGTTSARI